MSRALIIFAAPLLLALACDGESLRLTVDGLPSPAGEGSHATVDHSLRKVDGEIRCDSGEGWSTCILRIHADDFADEGESRSLTLDLPLGAGDLDLGDLPVIYDPATYAHSDDVEGLHPTFDWACAFQSGAFTLDTEPRLGEPTTGSLDVVTLCADGVTGATAEDVALTGAFTVVPTGADPTRWGY